MKGHCRSILRGALAASGFLLAVAVLASSQTLTTQRAEGDGQVIINTDLVTLHVSVTGPDGLAVPGLDKSAFTVFDDRVPQEISFFTGEDAPGPHLS